MKNSKQPHPAHDTKFVLSTTILLLLIATFKYLQLLVLPIILKNLAK